MLLLAEVGLDLPSNGLDHILSVLSSRLNSRSHHT